MDDALKNKIEGLVKGNNVYLFMKGTPDAPMCGFSAQASGILNELKVEYGATNVLADEEIRQGIKEYSDWPTIPQLYIKGEFIGGCDIITELYQSGELAKMLDQ